MALSQFSPAAKQMFGGNLLLLVCCACYLAWWLLAFRPQGAIQGIRTGWLLIPAFLAGLAAVILTIRGMGKATLQTALFPGNGILWGGVAAYLLLLAVTAVLCKRPVTTELILIVGWAMLTLSEVNTLFGMGKFSHGTSVLFVVIIGAAALISLVCYVLYYNLDGRAGYIDGMIPLLLAAVTVMGITVRMALD